MPLELRLRDDATLDNFLFFREMGMSRDTVQRALAVEYLICLHGPAASGRSHLLQALCRSQGAGDALYLPLQYTRDLAVDDLLEGVEQLRLLCLDDLDEVCGSEPWERALFDLCNRVREQGGCLLCSAAQPPRHLPLRLADLKSRLAGGLIWQLPEPGDEHKLAILLHRARCRGLKMSREAGHYIMSRAPRSLADLIALLDQLDRASLARQRHLTIPFIRSTLGW